MAFLAVLAHYNQKPARLASKGEFRQNAKGRKGWLRKKIQELTQLPSGVVIAEITPKVLPDTSVEFLHIDTTVCHVKW